MPQPQIIGQIESLKALRAHLRDVSAQCDAASIEDAAPSGAYDEQILNALWLKSLRREAARFYGKTVKTIKELESHAKIKPMTEYIVTEQDTLQSLSLKFYGTPHDWPKIMQANQLSSQNLTIGQTLVIPQ